MSAREWKPGDVALLRVERWSSATEWPEDTSQVLMRLADNGRYWNAVDGDPAAPLTVHVGQTDYYHPLVVIDPKDREQVARLYRLYYDTRPEDQLVEDLVDQMQAALREFANPKPAEPTGIGAVVVDDKGDKWVRHCPADCEDRGLCIPWRMVRTGVTGTFADFIAVRVLSEGVTEDGAS